MASIFSQYMIFYTESFYLLSLRFILHAKKTAFIVEHDFIMATYLADRVVVFEGIPSIDALANTYVFFFIYIVNLEIRK